MQVPIAAQVGLLASWQTRINTEQAQLAMVNEAQIAHSGLAMAAKEPTMEAVGLSQARPFGIMWSLAARQATINSTSSFAVQQQLTIIMSLQPDNHRPTKAQQTTPTGPQDSTLYLKSTIICSDSKCTNNKSNSSKIQRVQAQLCVANTKAKALAVLTAILTFAMQLMAF